MLFRLIGARNESLVSWCLLPCRGGDVKKNAFRGMQYVVYEESLYGLKVLLAICKDFMVYFAPSGGLG